MVSTTGRDGNLVQVDVSCSGAAPGSGYCSDGTHGAGVVREAGGRGGMSSPGYSSSPELAFRSRSFARGGGSSGEPGYIWWRWREGKLIARVTRFGCRRSRISGLLMGRRLVRKPAFLDSVEAEQEALFSFTDDLLGSDTAFTLVSKQ